MKACRHCGTEKEESQFYQNRSKRDGLDSQCKSCRLAYQAAHYATNRERVLTAVAAYRVANREVIAAYQVTYRAKNKVARSARQAIRYAAHRQAILARQTAYREANRAAIAERRAAHRQANLEAARAREAAYCERHRDEARARAAAYHAAHPLKHRANCALRRARQKAATAEPVDYKRIIARDAGRCYLCGALVDQGDLHIDHVIPLSKGGVHSYDNLRVTCSTCNLRKGSTILASKSNRGCHA